jgi:hypothetical protein
VYYRVEAIQAWLVSNEQGRTPRERFPKSGRGWRSHGGRP